MAEISSSPQLLILNRITEFCRSSGADAEGLMRRTLLETELPLRQLKSGMYAEAGTKLMAAMHAGIFDEEYCADLKLLFEKLLLPGDFADLAIHLDPGTKPERINWIARMLRSMHPMDSFIEERKPLSERSPAWEKLVKSLYERLGLPKLERLRQRKPMTTRRTELILRRVRHNVAQYCAVVRIPLATTDTFTPFMLTRIEAVIAAGLRFLKS